MRILTVALLAASCLASSAALADAINVPSLSLTAGGYTDHFVNPNSSSPHLSSSGYMAGAEFTDDLHFGSLIAGVGVSGDVKSKGASKSNPLTFCTYNGVVSDCSHIGKQHVSGSAAYDGAVEGRLGWQLSSDLAIIGEGGVAFAPTSYKQSYDYNGVYPSSGYGVHAAGFGPVWGGEVAWYPHGVQSWHVSLKYRASDLQVSRTASFGYVSKEHVNDRAVLLSVGVPLNGLF